MEILGRIEELIAPSLEAMGYELVRVRLQGTRSPTLQIMIERRDRAALTVEDCAAASRSISAILDVEDPVHGEYTLEVSSPGIDRPLVSLDDFERYAGFEAKIELQDAVDGRKRFRGQLLGTEGRTVRIEHGEGDTALPFDAIRAAKLVLTDALIRAAQEERQV